MSVLADCSLSIYLRDIMFYGTLQHNMTLCDEFEDNLKPIKEIRDTKSSDGIYNAFYEIYLSFSRVSVSAKLKYNLVMSPSRAGSSQGSN